MHRKVSHNQYSDEGCCFGAQYSTRVMSSIYRYCNSHELYFIGCTLSDILLSRLLVYVFCSWQDLMHAPACIHIGKKKRSGSITCPYVTRGSPPTQWGGGGENTDESFKKQHNKTFSNQYLYSDSVFSPVFNSAWWPTPLELTLATCSIRRAAQTMRGLIVGACMHLRGLIKGIVLCCIFALLIYVQLGGGQSGWCPWSHTVGHMFSVGWNSVALTSKHREKKKEQTHTHIYAQTRTHTFSAPLTKSIFNTPSCCLLGNTHHGSCATYMYSPFLRTCVNVRTSEERTYTHTA